MIPQSDDPVWKDYILHREPDDETAPGSLKVHKDLWSPQLKNRRDILVYLPPSYEHGAWGYPVIYMHDGQNLFDPMTSFAGEWEVDETIEGLSREGLEAIVVGIPNSGEQRLDEYSPFADPAHGGGGQGDQYVAFIVETVKPLVDRSFRTLPDRPYTGIMGSSMGGLISLYAFFHRPDIFGFTGAMSPSLWFANGALFDYIEQAPLTPGKIYLDVGTREGAGPPARAKSAWRRYPPDESNLRRMAALLESKGYRRGHDLLYIEEEGARHRETAWARRLPEALRFLLRVS